MSASTTSATHRAVAGRPVAEMSVQTYRAAPDPVSGYLNPLRALGSILAHRDLVAQLAARDLASRYRASSLGWLWSILTPLLMLTVYTLVFAVILNVKWDQGQDETLGAFALAMFSGMLVYNVFSEVMLRAPEIIPLNRNYVKKLVFPLEVLIVATLCAALVTMLISVVIWLVGWVVIMRVAPPLTGFWFPITVLPVVLLSLGLGWFCAALGAFLRDLQHGVAILVQVLFFLSPIFYSVERFPEGSTLRLMISLNPLTPAIEQARNVLMWGNPPDFLWLGISTLIASVIAIGGYAFFMKSKRAFADVV